MVREGNEVFLIRVWKPLPDTRFKTVRLMTIRNGSKRTISDSGCLDLSSFLAAKFC